MRKQCFFYVFETLRTKFAKNAEKQRFLSFCTMSYKKLEKTVFLHVFETLRTKFAKTAKNSVLHDVPQEVRENSVFSRFSRHFVQSSQNMRKNIFFAFCTMSCKKCEKTAFFHVFRDTLYEFAENVKKQRFLSFLDDVPQKVWENSVFSRFSKHFVQSSHKMRKNSVIWVFCTMSHRKCEKSVFFLRFSRHFVQISQNMRKNSVF